MKRVARGLMIAFLLLAVVASILFYVDFDTTPTYAATEIYQPGSGPAQYAQGGGSCSCSPQDSLDCRDFSDREAAQACFDQCLVNVGYDVYDLDLNGNGVACERTAYSDTSGLAPDTPAPGQSAPPGVAGSNNLVWNGNFEYGFYQVPQLGFEVNDVGDIPNYWGWYQSQTYGKVKIYNDQEFGIICADDVGLAQSLEVDIPDPDDDIFGPIPGVGPYERPNNSASMYFQSTDEPDMRLGIYQTVNVVPGRDYRFSMSGTIQIQKGAETLQTDDPDDPIFDQNHAIEVSFDPKGGTNWKAIPLEKRHIVEFKEEELEFKTTVNDPDIATIQSFDTVVRARSDKLTIFITAWRKWSNWRSTRFVVDCVALTPLQSGATTTAPPSTQPTAPSTEAETAAITQTDNQDDQVSPTEVQIIPPSGGIIENGSSSLLVIGLSLLLVLGLVGAGIWNIRRR
jgi:hypothetical protein